MEKGKGWKERAYEGAQVEGAEREGSWEDWSSDSPGSHHRARCWLLLAAVQGNSERLGHGGLHGWEKELGPFHHVIAQRRIALPAVALHVIVGLRLSFSFSKYTSRWTISHCMSSCNSICIKRSSRV